MSKHATLLVRILLALIIVIVLAIGVLFFTLTRSPELDRSQEVRTNSLSSSTVEFWDEVGKTFWIEDDYEETYQQFKTRATEAREQNAQNEDLTDVALNDEMWLMSSYAAIARRLYPEEGLQLYAQIYNTSRYTPAIRAGALFHAMFYLNEKLGTELSVTEANNWIFREGLFQSALDGSVLEGIPLETENDLRSAAILVLDRAAELTDSHKSKTQILALRYDIEVNQTAQKFIDTYFAQGGTPENLVESAAENMDLRTRANIELLLLDYADLEDGIIQQGFEDPEYDMFVKHFVHATKNVLRSYTALQSIGFDLNERFDALYDASATYMRFHRDVKQHAVQEINVQLGVIALYKACSEVIRNDYTLTQPQVARLTEILEPFTTLSPRDQSRFSYVTAVGQRGAGYCYVPYTYLGRSIPQFKEALITNVGGWEMSQFE